MKNNDRVLWLKVLKVIRARVNEELSTLSDALALAEGELESIEDIRRASLEEAGEDMSMAPHEIVSEALDALRSTCKLISEKAQLIEDQLTLKVIDTAKKEIQSIDTTLRFALH